MSHRVAVLRSHVPLPGSGEARCSAGPGQQLAQPGPDGRLFTQAGVGGLSEAQRAAYERDGFVVVRGNVPAVDLAVYRQRFDELSSGAAAVPKGVQVVRDLGSVRAAGGARRTPTNAATINKLQNLEMDPVLRRYARHPSVLRWLPSFTGDPGAKVLPFTSMLVNKPPDAGLGTSRHPIHQDLWFFPLRPANRMVCAWTALQRCSRENGALYVLPGSHRGPLEGHAKPTDGPVNAGFVGIVGRCDESAEDQDGIVWVDMQPGDTVFFHPLLHHGSGRNRSTGCRQAISSHYVGCSCVYFDPLRDPVQRLRAERVAATGGHQYGDADHVQLYRRRLRDGGPCAEPVYGQEGEQDNAV
eukprot:TRINITY_DN43742_c0_g1_i1.p2 TRINITY_DN43742_c0_g1~~TRINITY_DN43742_c0_g1_i1.p2  ORF type:complete len:376 (+),score=91.73 TRINITY_DN43742_c0_g1_i1:61-1128(+)